MNYKIVKCSPKVHSIESHLNKWAKEGWKYKGLFEGKGFFFRAVFLVMER